MNNYDALKQMSFHEFAAWLNNNCASDSIWSQWFRAKYCANCPTFTAHITDYNNEEHEMPYRYCDKYKHCYFFPKSNDVPSSLETIELWLRAEAEE